MEIYLRKLMTIIKTLKNNLQRVVTEGVYLAEVDGLRFVAIFLVILQHLSERLIRNTAIEFQTPIKEDPFAFLVSRGTVGVFLFFAISGFVLCMPFAKSMMADKPNAKKPSLKNFYIRRLTRIEPPYLIWMTLFAIVLIAKGNYPLSEMFLHWLASITYTHQIFFNDYSIINPVAWSLEIEIQFYILAPFLANFYFGISNKKLRRIGISVFIVAYIILMWSMGWLHFPMKATLLGRLPHFLIGFVVADYYLFDCKKEQKHLIWDFLAVFSLLIMCYTWTEELLKTVIFCIALTVFFISGFHSYAFNAFLKKPWIATFGGMCYTIYLTHLPLLEGLIRFTKHITFTHYYLVNLALQALIVVPIIGIASIVFYIFTEKPFMRKDWYNNFITYTILRKKGIVEQESSNKSVILK